MSATAKHRIIQALDELPEQSLATIAELVDLLRAKAVAGPAAPVAETTPRVSSPNEPRPFGLCVGEFTTPDDFNDPLPDEILDAFESR
jgi:hypothetical protein